MRIGIDYTAAARQRAGIGRYARELITALFALESGHRYVLFAATGGVSRAHWRREVNGLRAIRNLQFAICNLPLSDDWLARLWQRLRVPIPVEAITGALDAFYSPDFVLPPTLPRTRTLLTVHDLSFLRCPEAFVPALRRYLERVGCWPIRRLPAPTSSRSWACRPKRCRCSTAASTRAFAPGPSRTRPPGSAPATAWGMRLMSSALAPSSRAKTMSASSALSSN